MTSQQRRWAHIQEVEEMGGMAKAIEDGMPKLRIEEAAARTQARIDSGEQTVLGVNKFRSTRRRGRRHAQGRQHRCASSRWKSSPACAQRDQARLMKSSSADQASPGQVKATCSLLAVDAARAKATVGEISARGKGLEPSPGQFAAIKGVYRREAGKDSEGHRRAQGAVEPSRSRRAPPRRSSSPRWARTVTTAARRSSPRVRRPWLRGRHRPAVPDARGGARQAVENDVHIVAVSSLAAGHLTLVPELRSELAKLEPRRHRDRRRRRDPAAGLPTAP
jgi:methylmalonyl-CoA mutase